MTPKQAKLKQWTEEQLQEATDDLVHTIERREKLAKEKAEVVKDYNQRLGNLDDEIAGLAADIRAELESREAAAG